MRSYGTEIFKAQPLRAFFSLMKWKDAGKIHLHKVYTEIFVFLPQMRNTHQAPIQRFKVSPKILFTPITFEYA